MIELKPSPLWTAQRQEVDLPLVKVVGGAAPGRRTADGSGTGNAQATFTAPPYGATCATVLPLTRGRRPGCDRCGDRPPLAAMVADGE
jgi:hypothetical protein